MSATLTRYRVKPDRLDEHQRLIEAIFDELLASGADGFTFKVFRLDDMHTYLHVVITHDDDDEPDRLQDMPSYLTFAHAWSERCDETPSINGATVVGGWR